MTSEIVKLSNICCYFASVKLRNLFNTCKSMTPNQALDNYLKSLPGIERIAKSRDLREKMEWTEDQLGDRRRGRVKIDKIHFRELKKILGVELQADFDN